MKVVLVHFLNNQVLPPDSFGPSYRVCKKCSAVWKLIPPLYQLSWLPLSVRVAFSGEQKYLLAAGVIEPISVSAWVSPIIVTQWKSGKMCADQPNKAVIIDAFPLPYIEELLFQAEELHCLINLAKRLLPGTFS